MKCFIDMDGVLDDFAAGYRRKYKIDLPDTAFTEEEFPKAVGKSIQEIDSELDWDFWADLPWMPKGHQIIHLLENSFGKENCYLLTFPSYSIRGPEGKIIWVRRNLPDYSMRLILATVKYVCAGPDAVLFDDKLRNVQEFENPPDHSAGGRGVLVPAPWNQNAGHYYNIMEYLKERIEVFR